MKDSLSNEVLTEFFLVNSKNILQRRESSTVEFKTEFDWGTKEKRLKYIKSMVAFANSKGGYLIFGVGKSPHYIVGCNGFDLVDSAEITNEIANYFHCEVVFQKTAFKISGLDIGIIYIPPSDDVPIICTKIQHGDRQKVILQESAIYFRYSAKSDVIRAGDLVNLLSRVRQRINQKWMNSLSQIGGQGIDNIGILSTETGLLKVKDSTFLLDYKLLQDMKVVNKYSESLDGEPGIRIIGEIEGAATVINRNKTIEEYEVIQEFLERTGNYDYNSILERLPIFASFQYPFLYFLRAIQKKVDEYQDELLQKPKFSIKTPFIDKMLINHQDWFSKRRLMYPVSKVGVLSKKRYAHLENIMNDTTCILETTDDVKAFCQTIFNLTNDVDLDKIRSILLIIYRKHYNDSSLASSVREACCALEQIENI
jgi:hypothetical protein